MHYPHPYSCKNQSSRWKHLMCPAQGTHLPFSYCTQMLGEKLSTPAHTLLSRMVESRTQPSYFEILPKYKEQLGAGQPKQHMFLCLPIKPASLPGHVAFVTTHKSPCESHQSSINLFGGISFLTVSISFSLLQYLLIPHGAFEIISLNHSLQVFPLHICHRHLIFQ